MKKYIPRDIEPKWQKKWAQDNLYGSKLDRDNKYYVLAEFAYPSGDLHMGHWFTFGGADIYARLKRMQGYNVFFPNGFDAFGLPAENAAIKRKINPKEWTLTNIKGMREQFDSMGACFTFDHQVITCLPQYYKWNQWIFLKMLEKGIAYRGKGMANWCPTCNTVLADEQVVAGRCERTDDQVIQKEVEQWFLKITAYASELIWPETPSVDWPKPVIQGQNNWIGRSQGLLINFDDLKVFTTRPDTLFGATFVVISPEHQLLNKYSEANKEEVMKYVESAKKKTELERKENKDKSGVFTKLFVNNPVTGQQVPVWVADYVLKGYGTGAVMGVPAHDLRDFEFAKKYGLEIKQVIVPDKRVEGELDRAYEGEGVMINSGEYNGLSSTEARESISKYIVDNQLGEYQTQYHLHDWSISRQRYWGTPIPIIHCPNCGLVPVPEEDLPVELPAILDFTPKGKPPLAAVDEWVNVNCPKCKGLAKRDTDTMDGFFDNSWYFFRYLDPKNETEIFDKEIVKKWLPLEIYFGGAEHTLGHTLYSRFFTRFFRDLGLINFDEYAKKRVNHGIVLGSDGEKMSKSRGNVIDPDDEVKKYGADTIRLHMAFFMPYEGTGPWVSERINGSYHFLQRVWGLQEKLESRVNSSSSLGTRSQESRKTSSRLSTLATSDLKMMHRTIKKVTEDIENIKFNTAIAALMEWLNYLGRKGKVEREEYKMFLLLLAPFAPHITEELWQLVRNSFTVSSSDDQRSNELTDNWSIHQQPWPKFDNKYLVEEQIAIVIQINGKVRDTMLIHKDILDSKEDIEKMAKDSQKVQKFLGNKNSIKKTFYVPGKVINFVV